MKGLGPLFMIGIKDRDQDGIPFEGKVTRLPISEMGSWEGERKGGGEVTLDNEISSGEGGGEG